MHNCPNYLRTCRPQAEVRQKCARTPTVYTTTVILIILISFCPVPGPFPDYAFYSFFFCVHLTPDYLPLLQYVYVNLDEQRKNY